MKLVSHPLSVAVAAAIAIPGAVSGAAAYVLAQTAVDSTGIALVIASVTGLIAACFAGYVSIKQLPQIHKLTNSANTDLRAEIAQLRADIAAKDKAALDKAERRESPPN